jgi:polysaccharide pyruvyl transferase WcaK-like protein
MDGFYSDTTTLRLIELVKLAAKTGVDATILGFSFNEQPTPDAVRALCDLPASVKLCCRDALSHQRLTHHLQRPAEFVADVALLLEPAQDSELAMGVTKWVGQQRDLGRTIVGINANSLHLKSLPQLKFEDLIQLYADALVELFSNHLEISFLMIPHDLRDKESDVLTSAAILERLPTSMSCYCMKVPTPCRAAEIKFICADLDLVFTGRMHLAIAALGQGVPVAGVTYQGKFEGLFDHFNLQGMTITPEKALQPGAIASFLTDIIARREELRQTVQINLPKVQALSALNF